MQTISLRGITSRIRRNVCPPEVITGLQELMREYPDNFSYLNDMLMYTSSGKDRGNLTMEFVEIAREECAMMKRVFGSGDAKSAE